MTHHDETEVRRPIAPQHRSSSRTTLWIGIALVAAIAIIAVFFVFGADRAPTDAPELGNPATEDRPSPPEPTPTPTPTPQ